MLVLEPLCLCWSGQLCSSLGGSTGKDLPGFSQISAGEPWAWTEGTIGSSSQQRPPVRQSPAVARALLLLSRVGEWGQVVCWVGSGWPRAASPAQGDRGPQAGCCPVLGGLWLGMLSCPASGTAVSPWEG